MQVWFISGRSSEEEMTTDPSILAGGILYEEEPDGIWSIGYKQLDIIEAA